MTITVQEDVIKRFAVRPALKPAARKFCHNYATINTTQEHRMECPVFFDILVAAAKIEYLTPEHQCSIDAKPGLHRDNLEIRRTKSVS